MGFLHLVSFAALLGVTFCIRCHVVDNEAEIHCGDVKNMTCSGGAQFTPYCHKVPGIPDSTLLNGVCTCEQYCTTDKECPGGCPRGSTNVCSDAWANTFVKICLCTATAGVVG